MKNSQYFLVMMITAFLVSTGCSKKRPHPSPKASKVDQAKSYSEACGREIDMSLPEGGEEVQLSEVVDQREGVYILISSEYYTNHAHFSEGVLKKSLLHGKTLSNYQNSNFHKADTYTSSQEVICKDIESDINLKVEISAPQMFYRENGRYALERKDSMKNIGEQIDFDSQVMPISQGETSDLMTYFATKEELTHQKNQRLTYRFFILNERLEIRIELTEGDTEEEGGRSRLITIHRYAYVPVKPEIPGGPSDAQVDPLNGKSGEKKPDPSEGY